jgi:protein-L-isoaspartate(D-aspartate) O-methyltransferase
MKNAKKTYQEERESMVTTQIKSRGIKDMNVLEAMEKVPRHVFVPENMRKAAYNDEPLPIGNGQTISQPYIVAYMTEVLQLSVEEKVLEVGTGSGYQAAVLAEIAREVFTVEIIDGLSKNAQEVLQAEGYTNIHFRVGDGSYGWEENAPYDAIMVTAAPPEVPKALQDQLKIGGRMIVTSPYCQRKKKVQKEKIVACPVCATRKTTLVHLNCVFKKINSVRLEMKRIFPVLLIALAVCSLARTPSEDYIQVFFPNGKIITAELAVSDAERARGLMNREIINPDQGMLFVFDNEGVHSMWMKNMLIPLDFLWLDREQRIVHIEEKRTFLLVKEIRVRPMRPRFRRCTF